MIRKVLAPVFFIALLSSCHVGRFFIYNFADVRDYRKFPKKEISASHTPFHFADATGSGNVKLPKTISLRGKERNFTDALKRTGTIAFLVIRHDSILYEWHRPKTDRSTIVPSFSMSKSFVSALVGIAIGEGKIKSTDEPITNYIDFLDKASFGKVTIQHLLDMRSGIRFNESYFNPFGDIAKYYYGRNLKKYLRKLKVEEEPGKRFRYISLNTQLLALVLEKATGKSLTEYLQEKIWEPLGMESDASWSVDSKKNGTEKAFCCLNARVTDYAKIGCLYANKGKWRGKQIVPEAWVEQTWFFTTFKNNYVYSNHWWHTRNFFPVQDSATIERPYHLIETKDKTKKLVIQPSGDFFAQGLLGQYVYVYPRNHVVIVRVSKKEGAVIWPSLLKAIAEKN
jgi:CubicO group peptidase (beta-lactamase class C family)